MDQNKTGQRIRAIFGDIKISDIIFRLLIAWLMISSLFVVTARSDITSKQFFEETNLCLFTALTLLLWVALCAVRNKKLIKILMVSSALVYSLLGVTRHGDFYFSVGCCAAIGIVIYLTDLSDIEFKLNKKIKWSIAVLLIFAFTAFVGILCCLYYLNHRISCYDFGLFSQMFHYMKETGLPLTTCERDHLLNHFAVHFSPVFYLLLPFYLIIPSPCTLLIMQVLVVASGVIPLMLICKNHKLSEHASCGLAVIYTLYPCFMGGCLYYLHENNFLAPLILWLIYFCEKGQTVPKFIFLILLLSVKEDAAVYAAVIALYFLLVDQKRRPDIVMLLIAVVYFITVTHLMSGFGEGIMTRRYSNYIYDDSGSLLTMLASVIKNPIYVIRQCFTEEKLIFILQMLLPLGFLPFLTRNIKRYTLIIPFLLMNLMTNYEWQYSIRFQYCFGSGALLIYLAAVNYSELRSPKHLMFSAFSSVIIFFGIFTEKFDYFKAYADSSEERETIDSAVALIPEDASVCCSTFILPNLSQRNELYELDTTENKAEYYVLDLRFESEAYSASDYRCRYEEIFFKEGFIAVYKDNSYTP